MSDQGSGNLIAKVRNGYGVPTASVLANQDPVLWVNEGIARALERRGFAVERVQSSAETPELPTVTGQVTRASGGMYMTTSAEIIADLRVEQRGGTVGELSCQGDASAMAWTASADEFRRVFEAAMTDFADDCGPRLGAILSREPIR